MFSSQQIEMEDFYQSIARILFILIKCNEISIKVMYIKSFEIIKHPLIAHPCTNFISFFPQWMLLTFAQCRLVSLISTHSFRVISTNTCSYLSCRAAQMHPICETSVAQSCSTPCDPMDWDLPGNTALQVFKVIINSLLPPNL